MSKTSDIAGIAGAETKEITVQDSAEIQKLKAELLQQEIDLKKLEALEKKANIQDINERLAERELTRETKRQRSKNNGETLRQTFNAEKAAQERCNHRKGGNGAAGVVGGQGDDSSFAVLKHVFANGDMWIRCLRCGKTWKPPIRKFCESDAEYEQLLTKYKEAVQFQTRNVTSKAVIFGFSDNGQYYRERTANSNLR